MFDRTCEYKDYLKPGKRILVYWRFENPARRFHKAIVEEVGDDYVIVASRGGYWRIGPEKEGDKLEYDYDKTGDLYLTGPFGLSASKMAEYNGVKSMFSSTYGVYSGRVYIHPGSKLDD